MNKIKYLVVGAIFGVVFSLAVTSFAAHIQSMIGKKVDGEITVQLNGKNISEKAIVVDGRAHLPVRSMANSLEADVEVSNDLIALTTDTTKNSNATVTNNESINQNSKYANYSKKSLEEVLESIKTNILKPNEEERARVYSDLEQAKKDGVTENMDKKEKQLKEYDDRIAKYKQEIEEIENILKTKK